eukprot:UN14294
MKYVAKKVPAFTPFFFLLNAKSFVAQKKEVYQYEANSFKLTCFPQSLSASSCRMKLKSVVFRVPISTFFSENQSYV